MSLSGSFNCRQPGDLIVAEQTIEKFDVFRKKRNITDYEKADAISETEAAEMRELAETLRSEVEAWIRKHYPQFKP